MEIYKDLYFQLFAAVSDAVERMEELDFGATREALVKAQPRAEEAYMNAETV